MKSAFIRGLWGIYDRSHRILNRRYKIDNDIKNAINNKFTTPFVVYVFGRENYNQLLKTGIEEKGHRVVLIHEESSKFDLVKYQFRHKLEIIKYAMEVDGYDEIIAIDWDCYPVKEFPIDFWEEMRKKKPIQGCLQQYKREKCLWRDSYVGKVRVPNGGFLYLRDKEAPKKLIEMWENPPINKPDTDESAYAMYVDYLMGWKWTDDTWQSNTNYYLENFEPKFCRLRRMSVYTEQENVQYKDTCFVHHL